jgi:hypothetical protein
MTAATFLLNAVNGGDSSGTRWWYLSEIRGQRTLSNTTQEETVADRLPFQLFLNPSDFST